MNRKSLIAIVCTAVGFGLIASFIGRQIAPRTSAVTQANHETGPSAVLKPKSKIDSNAKAPATPAHEKAFLQEQLKAKPGHPPILLRLAEMEKSDGKLADARRHLEQAIKSDPTFIDARLELSLVCYQLGDVDEAEKQNQAVLKQDPKQPDALYNLGAIYANKNRLVEAKQYWSDAVKWGADTESGKNSKLALAKVP